MATGPHHARLSPQPRGYWDLSQQPLQSLLFLIPLLAIYEVGVWHHLGHDGAADSIPTDISARVWILRLFEVLGVTGAHLPAFIVVVVLLSLHFAHRDKWRFEPVVYLMMWVESLVLAFPLFVFMLVVTRRPELQQLTNGVRDFTVEARLILSIGAGIYEELLFRLIGIALLHMILRDALALPKEWAASLAIILSSMAFAQYHFNEHNPFTFGQFVRYTLCGLYLAVIYQMRGFGVVAATHAIYDILVTMTLYGWRLRLF